MEGINLLNIEGKSFLLKINLPLFWISVNVSSFQWTKRASRTRPPRMSWKTPSRRRSPKKKVGTLRQRMDKILIGEVGAFQEPSGPYSPSSVRFFEAKVNKSCKALFWQLSLKIADNQVVEVPKSPIQILADAEKG